MVREEEKEKVRVRAREQAEERVLDLLLPPVRPERRIHAVGSESERKAATPEDSATREKLRRMLREGKLDERLVELEVTKPVSSMIEVMTPQGMEEIETNLKEMLQNLLPEFQGRFPIRVELDALTQADFIRILTEPENALIRQYTALLATEHVALVFRDDAIAELARIAALVNERTENIGARRLHTVMERPLDEISFDAPEMGGREVVIDAA